MAYNITQAKQAQFEAVMLQKLKEEKGNLLLGYGQKAMVKGANTHTFYRLGESSVDSAGDFNMYKDAYTGSGGTAEKVTATIEMIYASDRIKKEDINSTTINLESSYIKSLSDALAREVDKKILGAIIAKKSGGTAAAGKLTPMGDKTKALTDTANIDALIQSAVYAATNVKDMTASTGGNGVALVLTAKEFSQLFTVEKIASNNYLGGLKEGTSSLKTFLACEVVKVSEYAKPKDNGGTGINAIYFIPTQTFGVASWENDLEAKSWEDLATDSIACRVKRSLGVAVIEPESIIEFLYKA